MLPSHAMQRALERCPGVCPGVLIRGVKHSVLSGDESIARFVARVRKEDFVDLYYMKLSNGLPRYALVCTPSGYIITFLEPGAAIWTTRGQYFLGENGLEAMTDEQRKSLCRDV